MANAKWSNGGRPEHGRGKWSSCPQKGASLACTHKILIINSEGEMVMKAYLCFMSQLLSSSNNQVSDCNCMSAVIEIKYI